MPQIVYQRDFRADVAVAGFVAVAGLPACLAFALWVPDAFGAGNEERLRMDLLAEVVNPQRRAHGSLIPLVVARLQWLVQSASQRIDRIPEAASVADRIRLTREAVAELGHACEREMHVLRAKLLAFWEQVPRGAIDGLPGHQVGVAYGQASTSWSVVNAAVGLEASGRLSTGIFSVVCAALKTFTSLFYAWRDLDGLADSVRSGADSFGLRQGHQPSATFRPAGSLSTARIVAGDLTLGVWNRVLGDTASALGVYSSSALERHCADYRAAIDALIVTSYDAQHAVLRIDAVLRPDEHDAAAVAAMSSRLHAILGQGSSLIGAHVMRQINYRMKIKAMIEAHGLQTGPLGNRVTITNAIGVVGIGSELALPLGLPSSNQAWYLYKMITVALRELVTVARMVDRTDARVANALGGLRVRNMPLLEAAEALLPQQHTLAQSLSA